MPSVMNHLSNVGKSLRVGKGPCLFKSLMQKNGHVSTKDFHPKKRVVSV